LLLEPNAQLRSAISTVLAADGYRVDACGSLEEVVMSTDGATPTVALVAWQAMEGLLSEQHAHNLTALTQHLRLVLMVPRRWAKLLEATDIYGTVAGMVSKPFEADELLSQLKNVLASS
jgi:DNA-binding response OmpR family regulator